MSRFKVGDRITSGRWTAEVLGASDISYWVRYLTSDGDEDCLSVGWAETSCTLVEPDPQPVTRVRCYSFELSVDLICWPDGSVTWEPAQ